MSASSSRPAVSPATQSARSAAQENRRITLIDMEKLFDPWVEHYASIADSDKPLMPIVPVYFLASRE
jgi:restriction system protein